MKTKTLLAFSLIIAFSSGTVKAQENERKHEISVGFGIWSTSNLAFGFGDSFANVFDVAGAVKFKEQTASPVYHANYKYLLTPRFNIGGTLTFGSETGKGLVGNQYDGKLKRHYSNIAAEVSYNYINKKSFKMYALGGLGYLYLNQSYTPENREKDSQSLHAVDFQISPLCVKVGDKIGGYFEAGFGYKGIVNAGIFYKLRTKN
jgi:hypothetical protein